MQHLCVHSLQIRQQAQAVTGLTSPRPALRRTESHTSCLHDYMGIGITAPISVIHLGPLESIRGGNLVVDIQFHWPKNVCSSCKVRVPCGRPLGPGQAACQLTRSSEINKSVLFIGVGVHRLNLSSAPTTC